MNEQLDLFSATNTDYEEIEKEKKQQELILKLEQLKKEREEFLTKNLTPRQHRLVDYLKDNFISGRYFTIEEICGANLGYVLNTNPKSHDKCIALGSDIRAINWAIGCRYSIIIKDSKGSAKLCESKEEFDEWKKSELEPLERKWKYLNNLEYKAEQDGTMPLLNLNDRPLEENEYEFVEVFKGEE